MKDFLGKVNWQHSQWEKVIANETTDKELIPEICKQLLQLNSWKINYPIKNLVKELNRHFSKEDIQMVKKDMKRCSASLIIRQVKIKTTMKYQLTLVRIAALQKSTINKCWRGCGVKRTLFFSTRWRIKLKKKKLGIKNKTSKPKKKNK